MKKLYIIMTLLITISLSCNNQENNSQNKIDFFDINSMLFNKSLILKKDEFCLNGPVKSVQKKTFLLKKEFGEEVLYYYRNDTNDIYKSGLHFEILSDLTFLGYRFIDYPHIFDNDYYIEFNENGNLVSKVTPIIFDKKTVFKSGEFITRYDTISENLIFSNSNFKSSFLYDNKNRLSQIKETKPEDGVWGFSYEEVIKNLHYNEANNVNYVIERVIDTLNKGSVSSEIYDSIKYSYDKNESIILEEKYNVLSKKSINTFKTIISQIDNNIFQLKQYLYRIIDFDKSMNEIVYKTENYFRKYGEVINDSILIFEKEGVIGQINFIYNKDNSKLEKVFNKNENQEVNTELSFFYNNENLVNKIILDRPLEYNSLIEFEGKVYRIKDLMDGLPFIEFEYVFDRFGNWIKCNITSSGIKEKKYSVIRKIEYYEKN